MPAVVIVVETKGLVRTVAVVLARFPKMRPRRGAGVLFVRTTRDALAGPPTRRLAFAVLAGDAVFV